MKTLLASLLSGCGLLMSALAPAAAATPGYPSKPIHIVVPWGAGTGLDTFTRALAKGLGGELGTAVVVENRVGAGGNIGTASVARAPGDGYTFVMGSNGPFAANPALYKDLAFDPIEDFTPVALIGKVPMLLIGGKDAEADTLDQVVAQARAQPGALNFGASNTTARVWVEYLKQETGIQVETVLYSNAGGLLVDMTGKQIQYAFENVGTSLPQIASGKLKALAVTSSERAPFAPDTPTVAESSVADPGLVVWFAMMGPKGVPAPVVEQVNKAVNTVLRTPELEKAAEQMGMAISGGDSAVLDAYRRSEVQKWRDLIAKTGISIE